MTSKELTADTITDEQIRELRDALVRDGFLFDASVEERADRKSVV